MTIPRTDDYLRSLLSELRRLPKETTWVEFKLNMADEGEIGEYISSLSNSAALENKTNAYLIWGVEDETHELIGTHFSPSKTKVGNEELENWLLRLLRPRINFHFYEFIVNEIKIVLLEIDRAFRHPVQFHGQEYIRIGSYKKRLKEFPELERELWRIFDHVPFESQLAANSLNNEDTLSFLDFTSYFELLGLPLPNSREGILSALESDQMIAKNQSGNWDITNLGAILFAKKLKLFSNLSRKAVRVVLYKGNSRVDTIKELEGVKGYASGYEGLIDYINNLLPSNEVVGKALRRSVPMYPELSIRELVANAIIHQDFDIRGAGPLIEIFCDRMEISNPGEPLIDIERFLDCPPRSRNEAMASFLRRIGVCEERGSGVDKVVFQTELYQLPAPLFEAPGKNTRVILFAPKKLAEMDKDDRIRACYLHACLRYVNREYMTNTSVRERFGIAKKNSAQASRIIKESTLAGYIKMYDPDEKATRLFKYMPFWA